MRSCLLVALLWSWESSLLRAVVVVYSNGQLPGRIMTVTRRVYCTQAYCLVMKENDRGFDIQQDCGYVKEWWIQMCVCVCLYSRRCCVCVAVDLFKNSKETLSSHLSLRTERDPPICTGASWHELVKVCVRARPCVCARMVSVRD